MPLLGTRGAASARGFGFFASLGDSYWIANIQNPGQGRDITVDSQGNLVSHGYGGQYGHTFKYNKDGVIQWQRRLGGTSANRADGFAVATDSSGNYIVSGLHTYVFSTITRLNFYVAKYDSSGTFQWQYTLGLNDQQTGTGYGLTTDSSNNIYVFSEQGVYAKFDQNGNIQWQNMLYSLSVLPRDLTTDSAGFNYLLAYGGPTGTSATEAVFVIKTDSSGVIQWQRRIAPSNNGFRAYGIACDASNNIYICGSRFNEWPSPSELVVVKLNSSGTFQWSRSIVGVVANAVAGRIAVSSSGDSYAIGSIYNGSRNELVITKYDTSGTLQWQRNLDIPAGEANGWGIALSPSGSVCVTGYAPNNDSTLFMKLPADGSKTGTYSLRGVSFVYGVSSYSTNAPSFTTSASSGSLGPISYSQFNQTLSQSTPTYSSATVPLP